MLKDKFDVNYFAYFIMQVHTQRLNNFFKFKSPEKKKTIFQPEDHIGGQAEISQHLQYYNSRKKRVI